MAQQPQPQPPLPLVLTMNTGTCPRQHQLLIITVCQWLHPLKHSLYRRRHHHPRRRQLPQQQSMLQMDPFRNNRTLLLPFHNRKHSLPTFLLQIITIIMLMLTIITITMSKKCYYQDFDELLLVSNLVPLVDNKGHGLVHEHIRQS